MTHAEATTRAARLGLTAVCDASGWCLLLPRGGAMAARGQTWEDALSRLGAIEEPPAEPLPPIQRGLFDAIA